MRVINALFKTPLREAMSLAVLGALSGLSFAPLHWWVFFVLSCTALLLRLDVQLTTRDAMKTVWWWSFGHLSVAFHWISFSLGVDLSKFFWVIPFSLFGIPAFLALFPALICGGSWRWTSHGVSRWLAFAAFWGVAEWMRGHWAFGGFGWNLASAMWGHSPTLLQSLTLWGPYGLSLLIVLLSTSPFLLKSRELSLFQKVLSLSCVLFLFLGLLFWGNLRFKPVPAVPGCWMRLVQPNVAQKIKWNREGAGERVENLFALSRQPSRLPLTHLLWPESPLPFILQERVDLRGYLLPLKQPQRLLTGMLRATRGRNQIIHVWNSLMIFDAKGGVEGCYDKAHLVPFGEYIPSRTFWSQFFDMSWLKKITAGDRDFVAGSGPRTLDVQGAPPVSPLICFDVAFPGEVVDSAKRPGWLLDITNDAWFEDSWGLYQHFEQGRMRAIEEGLPLVRVANTGISGVIDPYGQILAQLPILESGVHDFELPQALPLTFYSQWRDIPFGLMVLLLLLSAFWRDALFSRVFKGKARQSGQSRRKKEKGKTRL